MNPPTPPMLVLASIVALACADGGGASPSAGPAAVPGNGSAASDEGSSAATVDWSAWAEILSAHLSDGVVAGVPVAVVDYQALAADRSLLDVALAQLESADPGTMSRDEQLAFWINVYNVLAVDVVVSNWPVDSIRDVGGVLLNRVWGQPAGVVAGAERSLDEVEKEILIPMGEPRIHMAIVCASASCPDLRAEPFGAADLERQLSEQTRAFLANEQKGLRIDPERNRIFVSSIFKWYPEDFGGEPGIREFLAEYGPEAAADYLEAHPDARIEHMDYDWTVNARAKVEPAS